METHQFGIHPSIIYTLITAQASGVDKALLELVMNSIDAGANRIDIEIDELGFVVRDNGRGFKDIETIKECFGILGLPHEEGDAYYGRFRLGRMQTFGYAKTEWHTKNLKMIVDLNISPETESYGYEVVECDEYHQGCNITGIFYQDMFECDPNVDLSLIQNMSPYDVQNPIVALAISVKYAPIDVYINGYRCNKRRDEVVPMAITKKASYFLQPASRVNSGAVYTINVFNKGVFAYTIDNAFFLGDIVSSENISLNMARNEPKATCGVHRSIKNKLFDLCDELSASLNVVKTGKKEVDHERFIASFWSKLLGVNGECFEDELQFFSMYTLDWFQTPANKTISLNEIWRRGASHFVRHSSGNTKALSLHPLCFYSRDYLVEYGISPSQLDQVEVELGFIPFEILPDREFMMNLPEKIHFSFKLFYEDQYPLDMINLDVEERVDSSLTLNERYARLLTFLLKIHLTLSALKQYVVETTNSNGNSNRFYQTDFYTQYYYLKKFDDSLEIEDDRQKTTKYCAILSKYVREMLQDSLRLVENNATLKRPPRELGYEFCEVVKSREEFQLILDLNPFQELVLSELKELVVHGFKRDYNLIEMDVLDEGIEDDQGSIMQSRRLYLAHLIGAIGQTDAFNYLLVDVGYFKKCIDENKYLDLFCLIAHELAHDSSAMSMVHGEVFYMQFQMNMSDFYRRVGWMEESISEVVLNPKNIKSKEAFERFGANQSNVEYFLKKKLLKLKGRY